MNLEQWNKLKLDDVIIMTTEAYEKIKDKTPSHQDIHEVQLKVLSSLPQKNYLSWEVEPANERSRLILISCNMPLKLIASEPLMWDLVLPPKPSGRLSLIND